MHENWFSLNMRWMEYYPDRIKSLEEEMKGLNHHE